MPEPGLVVARFAMLALLLALAGIPFYLRVASEVRVAGAMRWSLAIAAVLTMAASVWWAMASVAAMAAMTLAELDQATFRAVLDATPLGAVLQWRLIGLAAFLLAVAVFPRTVLLAALGLAVLCLNVWTGHAGAAEGGIGSVQRTFDAFHLAAAALWLGALVHFICSVRSEGQDRALVARLGAFARIGTAIVIVLALTGLFNAVVIGSSGWRWSSGWSLLLGAKLALFAAMLGFAALNRWRLTPAFERGESRSERKLTCSLVLETTCMIGIVALVAVLGLLDPGGA